MQVAYNSKTVPLNPSRTAIVAFAAAGFTVVLAGIALACVPYNGEVSVYPVDKDGDPVMEETADGERPVTVHGGHGQTDDDGETRSGMIWCDDSGGFEDGTPYQAGAVRPTSDSPDLMLVVNDRTSGCADDSGDWDLPEGEYNVAVNNSGFSEESEFGDDVEFDVDNVSDQAYDRGCFFHSHRSEPAEFDYIHPDPLVISDGEDNDGSIVIEDLEGVVASQDIDHASVAGICLRADDHPYSNILPVEILPGKTSGNANTNNGMR